jgi:hypothetical protein
LVGNPTPHWGFRLKCLDLSKIKSDHFLQPIENKGLISQGRQGKGVTAPFEAKCYSFVNIWLFSFEPRVAADRRGPWRAGRSWNDCAPGGRNYLQNMDQGSGVRDQDGPCGDGFLASQVSESGNNIQSSQVYCCPESRLGAPGKAHGFAEFHDPATLAFGKAFDGQFHSSVPLYNCLV